MLGQVQPVRVSEREGSQEGMVGALHVSEGGLERESAGRVQTLKATSWSASAKSCAQSV